jgi:SIR2-like domain
MLDRIDHWRHLHDEQVAIVTFNYDLLIEYALNANLRIAFQTIDDLVSGSHYRLYKLHGSVNWTHPAALPDDPQPSVRQMIDRAGADLNIDSQSFHRIDNPGDQSSRGIVYPALAIPVLTKNVFECPSVHLGRILDDLGQVDRILVIGWRGSERKFLQLLDNAVDWGRVRSTLVVAESLDAANTTAASISAACSKVGAVDLFGEGFTGLLRTGSLAEFLSV